MLVLIPILRLTVKTYLESVIILPIYTTKVQLNNNANWEGCSAFMAFASKKPDDRSFAKV